MKISIHSLDSAPDELYEQLPLEAVLLREIPGSDRPDYWIAELQTPVIWNRDGALQSVTHLVVVARLVGTSIVAGMRNLAIGIAFVTDQSLLRDSQLDFAKCHYSAVGVADEVS
ncbi:MAG TPA: hypothetical protein VF710_14360 [Longimicrobium sp.]